MSSYEKEYLARLETCVLAAGGTLPPMSQNFQERSLTLLGLLSTQLAGGIGSKVHTGPTPPTDAAITAWNQIDSTGMVVERWQKRGSLWLSESRYHFTATLNNLTFSSSFGFAHPFPAPTIWLESFHAGCSLNEDFTPGTTIDFTLDTNLPSGARLSFWLLRYTAGANAVTGTTVLLSEMINQPMPFSTSSMFAVAATSSRQIRRPTTALISRRIYA